VAIENARLFKSERHYVDTLETLAEIGREMSSILDLDALLTRIASLTKRLIDYRTFGILLLDEETQHLEMKLAVRYGQGAESKNFRLGEGLVGCRRTDSVLLEISGEGGIDREAAAATSGQMPSKASAVETAGVARKSEPNRRRRARHLGRGQSLEFAYRPIIRPCAVAVLVPAALQSKLDLASIGA